MLWFTRAFVALVALSTSLLLPARAIADTDIFPDNVNEAFLTVGEFCSGDDPYQGLSGTYFSAVAPTYTIVPGTPLPPGSVFIDPFSSATGSGATRSGVKVVGTPTQVGLYSYQVDETGPNHTRRLTLNVYVFKDTASRDATISYTHLTAGAVGYDTFYWAALRGYWIGMGLNDEGQAYYNYYASLGGYYYTYYASTYPQYASYYYYYHQGLAFYYYYVSAYPQYAAYCYYYNLGIATYYLYAYDGDNASAVYFYNLYMGYANQSL